MNYERIGVNIQSPKANKIKPNPKDVVPVKKILKLLNKRYYFKGNKTFEEIIWYAFMPWADNPSKTWYFLCSSIALTRDNDVMDLCERLRKMYPKQNIKFESIYGPMYFKAIHHEGTYL